METLRKLHYENNEFYKKKTSATYDTYKKLVLQIKKLIK